MTWIEEHFAREYPEIKSIQDIWNKDDLGGYQTQRYSIEFNKGLIVLWNVRKSQYRSLWRII